MKKFMVVVIVLALYQGWPTIRNAVFGTPEYVTAGGGIVLYATEWCKYCEKTRELFAENGIAYVEYDIEKSPERNREYRQLGGRGVPLVNVGGTVIHGYAPDLILKTIRQQ